MALQCCGKPKRNGNYCYLNFLHSFGTKNKLGSHEKICETKDFCNVVMPSEDIKILEFVQYCKSDNGPFLIYAGFKCLAFFRGLNQN